MPPRPDPLLPIRLPVLELKERAGIVEGREIQRQRWKPGLGDVHLIGDVRVPPLR